MNKRQASKASTAIDPSCLQLLAVPEVARLLGVGRTTVYVLINTRQIQTVKIGNARRVPVIFLQQYIQRQMLAL